MANPNLTILKDTSKSTADRIKALKKLDAKTPAILLEIQQLYNSSIAGGSKCNRLIRALLDTITTTKSRLNIAFFENMINHPNALAIYKPSIIHELATLYESSQLVSSESDTAQWTRDVSAYEAAGDELLPEDFTYIETLMAQWNQNQLLEEDVLLALVEVQPSFQNNA